MEVFVISLAKHHDRYNSAETQLLRAGFLKTQIVHFPAVEGSKVNIDDESIVSSQARHHILSGSGAKNGGQFIPSRNALGCYLSHYRLWQIIASQGGDAMIAEDDIVFRVPNASRAITERWESAKKLGMEILLLGGSKLPLLPSTEKNVFHVMDHFFGTEGYIISAQGAERLLKNALPIKTQVDAYIGSFASTRKIKIGAVRPSISGQSHIFPSSVQNQTLKRRVFFKLRQQWLPALFLILFLILVIAKK